MSDVATFRDRVEAFIVKNDMTPTFFGKTFAGDPLFVFQIRAGREPRSATRERVLDAMSGHVTAPAAETAA